MILDPEQVFIIPTNSSQYDINYYFLKFVVEKKKKTNINVRNCKMANSEKMHYCPSIEEIGLNNQFMGNFNSPNYVVTFKKAACSLYISIIFLFIQKLHTFC